MDQLIVEFDKALRTLFAPARTVRPVPGGDMPDTLLSDAQREHVAGLMRVNHCGEICAQALYQGQAIMSRDASVRRELEQASNEETEHLAWTEQRIAELGGRKSLLNPLWYGGSLALGMLAGRLGDRWNLGFLAETERQVEAHLGGHLDQLPAEDQKSRETIRQMKIDEARHADTAIGLGAQELPGPVKAAMKIMARVMTTTSYRV
ncbi:2-polyprenyl-3-methyl-6-methoxy-1,4-benzoquinone monooxygenase [Aromatoleum toluolicum]|uniref:3-demethoxyubiquinol 3-hydroxylase n=1 Tax=Aromatoleum toluolicum TaxID=90060 RepID=A0ABX1NFR5_9RHOO|nr:2-polyprenyl-3-methyl-6-methoxy-1,4-benzoquinone monooxygenase [Aromatoleum toluolicum]NMF98142.1 2-polyprenyl-3-methyl-6-methoxy-1,4-benzoquinone monooxygenase [Aromatoleum toluolicum]